MLNGITSELGKCEILKGRLPASMRKNCIAFKLTIVISLSGNTGLAWETENLLIYNDTQRPIDNLNEILESTFSLQLLNQLDHKRYVNKTKQTDDTAVAATHSDSYLPKSLSKLAVDLNIFHLRSI